MALYLIGDLQGCYTSLSQLLQKLDFSPSRDTLYLLGDLVNRGPKSLEVLENLIKWGSSAQCVLGNHDLHLLAASTGARALRRDDTLDLILNSPQKMQLMDWLRYRPMALHLSLPKNEILMIHAGVLPSWTLDQTLSYAKEVEMVLQSNHYADFFNHMYGNQPSRWSDDLTGYERLRLITNTLSRCRFANASDEIELKTKEGLGAAPAGFMPWFEIPGRQTANCLIAFGHWSTMGLVMRDNILALDTGCVWGGSLSAVEIYSDGSIGPLSQVACEACLDPLKVPQ